MIKILVASTSKHKLSAVENAFEEIFPEEQITITSVKATSEINEQPVGNEEIIKGALNRMKNAQAQIKESFDYYVSVENGIVPVRINDKIWFDVGWVIVENRNGDRSFCPSAGIQFPNKFVNIAKEKGFATTTVGSIIAESTNCDSTDPHFFLTNSVIGRSDILKQAVKIAVGQFIQYTVK